LTYILGCRFNITLSRSDWKVKVIRSEFRVTYVTAAYKWKPINVRSVSAIDVVNGSAV